MNNEKTVTSDLFGSSVKRGAGFSGTPKLRGQWVVTCLDKDGNLKWQEPYENLVVNEGLDHALDVTLSVGSQETTWYVGLLNGTSPTIAAADTMASNSWTENVNYSESARQLWVDAGVSSQSVTNSASTADFSIDTNTQVISGAFLVADSAKAGTSGTLYAVGTFASDKSADSGDTLSVTATFTSADDGV